jgi:hypothetical protein
MRIILDSSVITKDYQLSGVGFRLLKAGLASQQHSAFVPEVVVDEVIANFRREIWQISMKVGDALRQHQRLAGAWLDNPLPGMAALERAQAYERQFPDRIRSLPAEILDYPTSNHKELVAKATARKKPFSEKGSGYRDALIWANVIDLAATDGQDIAFITLNLKDFADEGGELHPDLETELQGRRVRRDRVHLYNGLKPFLDEHVKPHLKKVSRDSIEWQFQAGVYREGAIEDQIGESLREGVAGRTHWEPSDFSLPVEAETISIRDVRDIDAFNVTEVAELDKREFSVEAVIEATFDVDFFVFKSDYWAMGEHEISTFSIWDKDWNEHYMLAEASREARAGISLAIDENGQIKAATVDWIEAQA